MMFNHLVIGIVLAWFLHLGCINDFGLGFLFDEPSVSAPVVRATVPNPDPFDLIQAAQKERELLAEVDRNPSLEVSSDLALLELILGKTEDAIARLEELLKGNPDEYHVLANLGTAYEISGRSAEALRMIERAYEVNPRSHLGSEWIHVNLLRRKVATPGDGSSSYGHSYAGLDFGSDFVPRYNRSSSADNAPTSVADLRNHLRRQLNERRKFVRGPDPVVASLMFDLGNAVAVISPGDSLPFFGEAEKLGFGNTSMLSRRMKFAYGVRSQRWWDRQTQLMPRYVAIAVLVFVIGLGARVIVRRLAKASASRGEAV
ncbi:MAG: tetratricopeptide repeat protein [Planctomycetota bacterium]